MRHPLKTEAVRNIIDDIFAPLKEGEFKEVPTKSDEMLRLIGFLLCDILDETRIANRRGAVIYREFCVAQGLSDND